MFKRKADTAKNPWGFAPVPVLWYTKNANDSQ